MKESKALDLIRILEIDKEEHADLYNALIKVKITRIKKQILVVENLTAAFTTLASCGATVHANKLLFLAVIEHYYVAGKIALGFAALNGIGATVATHNDLFWAVIKHYYTADKLAARFAMLTETGATVHNHEDLFLAVIQHPGSVDKLATGFAALKCVGATVHNHEDLFLAVIQHPDSANKLATAFKRLTSAGATLESHKYLFWAVIEHSYYADRLALGFLALNGLGVTVHTHEYLFCAVIQHAVSAGMLTARFAALNGIGATILTHKDLFLAVITHWSAAADKLAAGFAALNGAGATVLTHKDLYLAVIKHCFTADKLAAGFAVLKEIGATVYNHDDLFLAVIKQCYAADKLAAGFAVLNGIGATVHNHDDLFLAVITHWCAADKLAAGFAALNEIGATVHTHKDLFLAVITHCCVADKLAAGFAALNGVGATILTHKDLFLAVITDCCAIDKLAAGFAALNGVGATVLTHKDLFVAVIKQCYAADKLAAGFAVLNGIGATVPTHKNLFLAVIRDIESVHKCASAFSALRSIGATVENNKNMFLVVIQYSRDYADEFTTGFKLFKEIGLRVDQHEDFFWKVLKKFRCAKNILVSFNELKDMGATVENSKNLFLAVIQKAKYADKLSAVFTALKDMGITPINNECLYMTLVERVDEEHMNCLAGVLSLLNQKGLHLDVAELFCSLLFNHLGYLEEAKKSIELLIKQDFNLTEHLSYFKVALNNPGPVSNVLYHLQELGLNKKDHGYIYRLLFSVEASFILHSHYHFIKWVNDFKGYVAVNRLLKEGEFGYHKQCEMIEQRMNEFVVNESQLTEGPLNKSASTKELERILRKLTHFKNRVRTTMYFDETHGYILKFHNEPEIYINHLLGQVNFNHLELSDSWANRLGAAIHDLSGDFNGRRLNGLDRGVSERLPIAAQEALRCYVGNKQYKNMNRLFRGLAPVDTENHTWISPVDGRRNLLANFLCGCLVNLAAKELPLKVIEQLPESEVLLLDRGENLTGTEELAVIERRLANPVFAPSVISVSVHKQGSTFFHKTNTTRTKFEHNNKTRPVINEGEGEQLIPHGSSFIYTRNPDGVFFAKEVNSPGIVPTGSYWSATALSYAYHHHLRNPYADTPSQITVNDTPINRPNHGLAHTYRVMTYIKVVVNYFAQHARDEAFRLFCTYLSEEEQDWLMVAAAFRITGRESEVAAKDNLERYDEYRQASQDHFSAFLKKHPPKQEDAAMQERMEHIVRYMGNPAYEEKFEHQAALNGHDNKQERVHRNFIHRILSTAHKLDLPRCNTPERLEQAMASCRSLSVDTPKQKSDYQRMLAYAIYLIKAHGNALATDITTDGALIHSSKGYEAPFDRASTCIRDLQALTGSIPGPKLAEQYQLPSCEKEVHIEGQALNFEFINH